MVLRVASGEKTLKVGLCRSPSARNHGDGEVHKLLQSAVGDRGSGSHGVGHRDRYAGLVRGGAVGRDAVGAPMEPTEGQEHHFPLGG